MFQCRLEIPIDGFNSQHMFSQPSSTNQSHRLLIGEAEQSSVLAIDFERLLPRVIFWEPCRYIINSYESQIFHHFVVETSKTLVLKDLPAGFWNTDIPRMALQNDYLMNAVLAISALHKSHLAHSNGQLPFDLNKSFKWHSKSVQSFAQVVANITPENCVPALAMAAISAMYSCGVAQILPNLKQQDHIEQLVAIILIVHGTQRIFQPLIPWLNTHGLSILGRNESERSQNNATVLKDIASRLSILNAWTQNDTHEKQAYEDAISVFRDFDESNQLAMLAPSYLALLREKKPMAILIFAAFSTQNKQQEPTPWWLLLWRSKIREYVVELLGPLWNQYISLGEDDGDLSLLQISNAH